MVREAELFATIEGMEEEMVEMLCNLIKIPAVGPMSGGEGEMEKAKYVETLCREAGFDEVKRYDSPSPDGPRPNVVAVIKGKDRSRRLWFAAHLDVVPPGDLGLWKTDPFTPVIKGKKIFGRGSQDNGQDMAASFFALKALLQLGVQPAIDLVFLAVADEETTSAYGMRYLIKRKVFRKGDIFVIPDGGVSDGSLIEVAEKAILWLKVEVLGKQCHGSRPQEGINAMEAGSLFIAGMEEIRKKFREKNPNYYPTSSTFEPTKRLANVPNINTIPGTDTFFLDCRVLPCHPLPTVIKAFESLARKIERKTGAQFSFTPIQREESTETDPKDPFVRLFAKTVKEIVKVSPKIRGVGWRTVASFVRQAGYPAVVWTKVDMKAHAPNEYALIPNMVIDAKVFAALAFRIR